MSTDIATEKPDATSSSAAPTEDNATSKTEEGSTEKDVEMGDDERKDLLKACRQVEFYFADSNLPYDRFMWTLHTKNPEHWVPISTVASFKRMREHTARGLDWVVKAVRLSEELELDAEGVNVRRTTEVQEPKDQFERSVYAKGFGDEDSELQGKLEAFFDKYGKTNAVRMRRGEKKVFKGSVFVEFTDFKSVDAFLNAEPKPTWEGKELLIMSKQAYCDMKIKEKGLTGKAAVHRKELINRRGFNAFQENNEPERRPATKAEVFLEFMGKKIRVQQDEEGNGTVKEEDVPFISGASLKFEGCDGQVDFQHIKKSLKDKFSRSPFIKYNKGENHGLVGFDKALSTEEIDFVKETLKTLNDKEITWAVASEEEDKALQIERAQFAARSILTHAQDGKGGRGGGRGGRGGGRGGRGRGGRGGPHGGGRGGSRNRERAAAAGESKAEAEEQAGDKRKRAVEPDGGPDVGVRGTKAPPSIQPAKKTKVDDAVAS